MSLEMYIQWKENPTITTINTTAYPIKNVEFPAITICSQGSAKDILDAAMLKQFERFLKSKGKIKPKVKQEKIVIHIKILLNLDQINTETKTLANIKKPPIVGVPTFSIICLSGPSDLIG